MLGVCDNGGTAARILNFVAVSSLSSSSYTICFVPNASQMCTVTYNARCPHKQTCAMHVVARGTKFHLLLCLTASRYRHHSESFFHNCQKSCLNQCCVFYEVTILVRGGTRWRSWLRHCNKPEGREFDSRWCNWDFSLT